MHFFNLKAKKIKKGLAFLIKRFIISSVEISIEHNYTLGVESIEIIK